MLVFGGKQGFFRGVGSESPAVSGYRPINWTVGAVNEDVGRIALLVCLPIRLPQRHRHPGAARAAAGAWLEM
jgi:hypothetical protein